MTSKSDVESSIRDQIVAQQDKVTRLHGDISPETVDNLEEELGGIVVNIKSHHFVRGAEFGHLSVIIPQSEFADLIGDDEWEYEPPEELDAYDPDAIALGAAQRSQAEAEWKRKIDAYETYLGVCAGLRDLIVLAVGEDAVVTLKKKYVNYGAVAPHDMISHL